MGAVTHYFPEPEVAVVKVEREGIEVGDRLHITGHTTDLTFEVASMEIDHDPVQAAGPGDEVGMKVPGRTRENDEVFKVSDGAGDDEEE